MLRTRLMLRRGIRRIAWAGRGLIFRTAMSAVRQNSSGRP